MKLSPVKQAFLFSVEDGGHMFLITSERGNTIALFNRVLDPVHLDSAWHFATIPGHKQRQGNLKPVNNPCFCFTTDFWAGEGEPPTSLKRNLITGSVGRRLERMEGCGWGWVVLCGCGCGTGPIELHYRIMWRVETYITSILRWKGLLVFRSANDLKVQHDPYHQLSCSLTRCSWLFVLIVTVSVPLL